MKMNRAIAGFAVLTFCGVAAAQPSVTIGGNINLGLVKTTGAGVKLDAANGTSQISLRGTEDLGGNLSTNFRLSMRFSPESGGLDGTLNKRPLFQGESTVGLSGDFGSFKVGRALTALQVAAPIPDPFFLYTVASLFNLSNGYVTDAKQADNAGGARTDAITYASPNFGGLTGTVSWGPKNSVAVAGSTAQAKNLLSAWLSYASGSLLLGGGAEQNRTGDRIASFLGRYDFGGTKVMAGYSEVDAVATDGRRGRNWNIGLTVPMGLFTAKAGYYNSAAEGSGVKTSKVGLGGEYALSKRTYLYTSYGHTKRSGRASINGFDFGINHSF